jgi:hypothetical protein
VSIPWLTLSGTVVAAIVGLLAAYIGGSMQRQATERALDRELRTQAIADFTETLTTIMSDLNAGLSLDPDSSEGVNARNKVRAGYYHLTAIGLRVHLLGLRELDKEVEAAKEATDLASSNLVKIQRIFYAAFKEEPQGEDKQGEDFTNANKFIEAITEALGTALGAFIGRAQYIMTNPRKHIRLLAWIKWSGNHHEDDRPHTNAITESIVPLAEKSDG